MKVIGLTGGPGNGAGAVADTLLELKTGCLRSFNGPLLAMMAAVFCRGDLVEAARVLFGYSLDQMCGADERCLVDPFWQDSPEGLQARLEQLMLRHYREEVAQCREGKPVMTQRHLIDAELFEGYLPCMHTPKGLMAELRVLLEAEFGVDLLVKRAEREIGLVLAAPLPPGEDPLQVLVFDDADELPWAEFISRAGALVEVKRAGVTSEIPFKLLAGHQWNDCPPSDLRYHVSRDLNMWLNSAADLPAGMAIGYEAPMAEAV